MTSDVHQEKPSLGDRLRTWIQLTDHLAITLRGYWRFVAWGGIVGLVYYLLAGPILHSELLLEFLIRENRVLEHASSFSYLGAAFIGFRRLRGRWRSASALLAVPFLGVLGFLEETGFGYEVYGWYKKTRVAGKKVDSLHDFFQVFGNLWSSGQVSRALVVPVAAVAVLLMLTVLWLLRFKIIRAFRHSVVFRIILSGALFIIAGSSIDLLEGLELIDPAEYGFPLFLEELFETFGAVALFCAATAIPVENREQIEE